MLKKLTFFIFGAKLSQTPQSWRAVTDMEIVMKKIVELLRRIWFYISIGGGLTNEIRNFGLFVLLTAGVLVVSVLLQGFAIDQGYTLLEHLSTSVAMIGVVLLFMSALFVVIFALVILLFYVLLIPLLGDTRKFRSYDEYVRHRQSST